MAYITRVKTWSAEILTASDLNAEFNNVLTGLSGGSKDINMAAATFTSLTVSGACTFNGAVALGSDSSDAITPNGIFAGALLATDATYALGGTSNGWTALYLDNAATDGGAVYFDGSNTSFFKCLADGTQIKIGGVTSLVPNTASLSTLGTATLPFAALYLDNTATDAGAVYFDAGSSKYMKLNAAGTQLDFAGIVTIELDSGGTDTTLRIDCSTGDAGILLQVNNDSANAWRVYNDNSDSDKLKMEYNGTNSISALTDGGMSMAYLDVTGDDTSAPTANRLYAANILKGWAHMDVGAAGAVTISNDHNIASASWSVSVLTVSHDTAMGNSTYCVMANISNNAGGNDWDSTLLCDTFASATFDINQYQNDGGGVELWESGDDLECIVVGDMS